ncbi:MAG: MFS transporter [Rhodospirillaceae bacterium]|nr:MFS transporter [Rhodospirillaceae bacterium]
MMPHVKSAEELSAPRRWVIFAAVMLPYVFYAFCWNTENFLRPYIAEALGLSKTEVASFYTLQALGALIGAIILSQIADRFSRRNTFALTAIGFGLAALGVVFVDGLVTALVQRFIMGFFMGGVFGCAVSLYVGLFPPHLRGLLAGFVQLVYNGGDALLSWFGRHYDSSNWQVVLEIGGIGALCAAVGVFLVVPNDRSMAPWGSSAMRSRPVGASAFVVRDLFIEGRWRLTIRLALMCGLNFFAFQAFSGWATTYLRELQGYSPDLIGRLMTVMHVGSMSGALIWGMIADRMGRRASAAGFMVAAVFIVFYLNVSANAFLYGLTGFAYGFGYVCSGVWGPYFAELYPEHLRATAASIFNWGRIVSLFGALVAGAIAEAFGLQTVMYVGAATFAAAGALWWSLPETLPSRLAMSRG